MKQALNREDAAKKFYSFLSNHHVNIGTMNDFLVAENQLIPHSDRMPRLTKFKALGDVVLYSDLLTELVKNYIPLDRPVNLIDLGAGSSIPTLNALFSSPTRNRLKIIAVDNDPEAIQVGKQNVEMYGFNNKYSFIADDMLNFLSKDDFGANYVLASNPPFLPAPSGLTDPFYGPVDGGTDGTKYLKPLLLWPMRSGTIVAVRWCSLGNPCKIINLIEDGYDVLHIKAHETVFGPYASSKTLFDYMKKQVKPADCISNRNRNNVCSYTSVECILRRR